MANFSIYDSIPYPIKWSARDFRDLKEYDERADYLNMLVCRSIYNAADEQIRLMERAGYGSVSLNEHLIRVKDNGLVDVEIKFLSWSKRWKVVNYFSHIPSEIVQYHKLLLDVGPKNVPKIKTIGSLIYNRITEA